MGKRQDKQMPITNESNWNFFPDIQSVSKVTFLGFSNFLKDEREYCETFEIHQRQHWSQYQMRATFHLILIISNEVKNKRRVES